MSKNAILNEGFAAYDGKSGSISTNPAEMSIGCIINKVNPVSAKVDIPYIVLPEIIDIYVFLDSAAEINTASAELGSSYCASSYCASIWRSSPSISKSRIISIGSELSPLSRRKNDTYRNS